MKIAILGASGYLGQAAAWACAPGAESLVLLGRSFKVLTELGNRIGKGQVVVLDLASRAGMEVLAQHLDDVDCVLHVAGRGGEAGVLANLGEAVSCHVSSVFVLQRWLNELPTRRLIYVSSMAVYGKPSPYHKPPYRESDAAVALRMSYGALKASAERLLRDQERALILRLPHVYGIGPTGKWDPASVFSRWANAARTGGQLTLDGDGSHVWQFLSIQMWVHLVCYLVLRAPVAQGSYNVPGEVISLLALADLYCATAREMFGKAPDVRCNMEQPGFSCWMDGSELKNALNGFYWNDGHAQLIAEIGGILRG